MLTIMGVLTPILVLMLGGLGWLYRNEFEKRRAIEEKLSQEKYETYLIFINLFFDFFEQGKLKGKGSKEIDALPVLSKFRRRLVVYGSDGVLRAFIRMMRNSFSGSAAPSEIADAFGGIIVEIRRDMGSNKTLMTPLDLMAMMVTDLNREEENSYVELIRKYRSNSLEDYSSLNSI